MGVNLVLAIRALPTAIDSVKRIFNIASETKNVELQEEILALRKQVLEMESGLLEAKAEITDLKEKNNKLVEQLKGREGGVIYNPKPRITNGLYAFGIEFGLFCTGCYDSKKEKIRVTPTTKATEDLGKYQCPVCKTGYKG